MITISEEQALWVKMLEVERRQKSEESLREYFRKQLSNYYIVRKKR